MSPFQDLLDTLELNTQSNFQLAQLVGELIDVLKVQPAQDHITVEVRGCVQSGLSR